MKYTIHEESTIWCNNIVTDRLIQWSYVFSYIVNGFNVLYSCFCKNDLDRGFLSNKSFARSVWEIDAGVRDKIATSFSTQSEVISFFLCEHKISQLQFILNKRQLKLCQVFIILVLGNITSKCRKDESNSWLCHFLGAFEFFLNRWNTNKWIPDTVQHAWSRIL